MLGWLKAAVVFAVRMYGWIQKTDQPSIVDALPFAVGQLLPAVRRAIEYQGFDTKEKLDEWMASLDEATGADIGAVDFIGGLPPDKEEEFFDHLIEAARIYGYHLIGVDGYDMQPVMVSKAVSPEETGPAVPIIAWNVQMRCELPMSPQEFESAWKTRLPTLIPEVLTDICEEKKVVFDLSVVIDADNNVKAASMAKDTVRHHFSDLAILSIMAEELKE